MLFGMAEAPTQVETPISRDELIALVARAHLGAPYGECKLAGAALADQSKLPRLIAENLGAGFGQWTFFPEPREVVEFACTYVPPANADDAWALARKWAEDDAASRPTVLALIGRELMQVELRRVAVPELAAFFNEPRGALALREKLGLAMPAARARPAAPATAETPPKEAAPRERREPRPAPKPATPSELGEGLLKMPKPILTRAKVEPAPAPRHFEHPKFGSGVLEKIDGTGADAKLTIRFASGTKTLLARFVTEVGS
jgi:hypothetical protein